MTFECKYCSYMGRNMSEINSNLLVSQWKSSDSFLVFCPNCETMHIAEKTFLGFGLKCKYTTSLMSIIEYTNAIYDNSEMSILEVLKKKVGFCETITKKFLDHGCIIIDEYGIKTKRGEYSLIYSTRQLTVDDHKSFRKSNVLDSENIVADINSLESPWNKCDY